MYLSPETAEREVSMLLRYSRNRHAPCLTLGLEECKDVVDTDWALHVTDDRTACIIEELNPDLGDTTTRTGTAEDLHRKTKM